MNKPTKKNVASGIVTFNRKEDLIRCIESNLNQSTQIDKIFIIDNASTDGTLEFLTTKGYVGNLTNSSDEYQYSVVQSEQGTEIEYRLLPKNIGGAGGFNHAQTAITESGYEWMWLMDDDGFATPDCLKTLFEFIDDQSLKIANPLVLNINDKKTFAFGLSKRITTIEKAQTVAGKAGVVYNYGNPFNGTLIHKSVISKIGFIKKEMFIWGDEVEYFERVKKNKIPYATVVDAIYYHPKNKSVVERMFGKIRIVKKPEHLEMNFYRNKAYIFRKHKRSLGFLFLLKYTVYFLKNGAYRRLLRFYAYYFDGWFGLFIKPGVGYLK